MTTFRSKAINMLVLFTLVLSILNIFIVVTFFTNDKTIKYTISQAPSVDVYKEDFSRPEAEKETEPQTSDNISPAEPVAVKETNSSVQSVSNEKAIATTTSSRSATVATTKESKKTETSAPSTISSTYQGYSNLGRIQIPKTGVDLNILSNVSVNGLEIASCFLYSTGTLNQNGNTLIVGHNYMNGKLFSNNYKLQIGDVIYITTLDGKKVTYKIYEKFITTPEDISYIRKNSSDKPGIALSCCTNDETGRLVILAKAE